ncbi:MAG: ROK family protein [Actinomycetota bacterium]|nr:ROK family protein [Actinomycetota bacterium]
MRFSPLPDDARVLAVDVGGGTIKGELVDEQAGILSSAAWPTPPAKNAVDTIARLGRHLIDQVEAEGGGHVSRAGLVIPGIVDRERGRGVYSGNVGWRQLDFRPTLQSAWDVPVLLDHDVTIAGWAEWQVGAGRECDDMFFVALGTGVAAAIVAGGRLLRGGLSQGGEFGHVVVRPGGPVCSCGGSGCLEAVSSASAIARAYTASSGQPVEGAADVLDAMTADPVAVRVWEEALSALADGLVGVVNLLSPARIVLGGGLAASGDALVEPLRHAVAERVNVVPIPEIVPARFGRRAGVVGAGLLARRGGTGTDE